MAFPAAFGGVNARVHGSYVRGAFDKPTKICNHTVMKQIKSDSGDSLLAGMVECPCMGATLPKFVHPAILIVLADGPAHGYQLVERLTHMPTLDGERPDSTGIYRTLATMEKKGFVLSEWETSGSGPAKKIYHITQEGRHCLATWAATLKRHADALRKLAQEATATCRTHVGKASSRRKGTKK